MERRNAGGAVRCAPTMLCILFCIALAACQSTAAVTATPPPISAWGDVVTLGQAAQTDAPALWVYPDRVEAAWVQDGRHIMRGATPTLLSAPEQLPLPPVAPRAQFLAPAAAGHTHLLWLDRAYDAPDTPPRLWSAVFTPERLMERGPVRVTEPGVFRYDAVPDGNKGLWVVWSGGLPAEPTLYAQRIDAPGRPGEARPLTDGDWPSLVPANDGQLWLFWLDVQGRVWWGELRNGQLQSQNRLADSPRIEAGDRLLRFEAALDATTAYALWNIARRDGTVETWLATGHDPIPRRLGIETDPDRPLTTGFNGGQAQAANPGTGWLSWTTVLPGQHNSLALAAQVEDSLGIVYLREGVVQAYQPVVGLDEIGLIGFPALRTDRDRHLYLAYAQPTTPGAADLNLVLTK